MSNELRKGLKAVEDQISVPQELEAHLVQFVTSRDVIGSALGILEDRIDVSSDFIEEMTERLASNGVGADAARERRRLFSIGAVVFSAAAVVILFLLQRPEIGFDVHADYNPPATNSPNTTPSFDRDGPPVPPPPHPVPERVPRVEKPINTTTVPTAAPRSSASSDPEYYCPDGSPRLTKKEAAEVVRNYYSVLLHRCGYGQLKLLISLRVAPSGRVMKRDISVAIVRGDSSHAEPSVDMIRACVDEIANHWEFPESGCETDVNVPLTLESTVGGTRYRQ